MRGIPLNLYEKVGGFFPAALRQAQQPDRSPAFILIGGAMNFSKLHPFLVHFPMGLLVSGVLFEFYGKLAKEKVATTTGKINIRLGF